MVTRIAGLLAGLILCASAYGQTADDCITRFEQLRGEFEAAAAANGRPDLVCGAEVRL
jgi:hypothetical protein